MGANFGNDMVAPPRGGGFRVDLLYVFVLIFFLINLIKSQILKSNLGFNCLNGSLACGVSCLRLILLSLFATYLYRERERERERESNS